MCLTRCMAKPSVTRPFLYCWRNLGYVCAKNLGRKLSGYSRCVQYFRHRLLRQPPPSQQSVSDVTPLRSLRPHTLLASTTTSDDSLQARPPRAVRPPQPAARHQQQPPPVSNGVQVRCSHARWRCLMLCQNRLNRPTYLHLLHWRSETDGISQFRFQKIQCDDLAGENLSSNSEFTRVVGVHPSSISSSVNRL